MPDWVVPLGIGILAQFVAIALFIYGQRVTDQHRHDLNVRELCGRFIAAAFILIRFGPDRREEALDKSIGGEGALMAAGAALQFVAPPEIWSIVHRMVILGVQLMPHSDGEPEWAALMSGWVRAADDVYWGLSEERLRGYMHKASVELSAEVRKQFKLRQL